MSAGLPESVDEQKVSTHLVEGRGRTQQTRERTVEEVGLARAIRANCGQRGCTVCTVLFSEAAHAYGPSNTVMVEGRGQLAFTRWI